MTKLVINSPDIAEGTEIEIPDYGVVGKVGETVDIAPQIDGRGNEIPVLYLHPVKEEDTDATDTVEGGTE